MDTGDIILKEEVTIGEDETTGELWERLAILGGKLLNKTLQQIEEGKAPRIKQNDNFTIAPMLNKAQAKIDWENQNAYEIKNLIRGLDPIMGAYAIYKKNKIKFWKAKVVKNNDFCEENNKTLKNGTILKANSKEGLFIKAKEGVLQILEIQAPNSKRMKVEDYLRGNKIDKFEVFE